MLSDAAHPVALLSVYEKKLVHLGLLAIRVFSHLGGWASVMVITGWA
ncbi:MAG: hypothetical protein WBD25_09080 [Terriglobales bacterium]|jgi:hypothetical protein